MVTVDHVGLDVFTVPSNYAPWFEMTFWCAMQMLLTALSTKRQTVKVMTEQCL